MNQTVHTFHTKDGIPIRVRPLQPEDIGHLIDLFEHMGQESRYARFNMDVTDPDPELMQREAAGMVNIERPESDGWLAFADLPDQPDAPVAGVRYVQTGEGEAEVALSVRDDMQNKGIGTALLLFLIEKAKKAGIHKLVALAQRNNRPLWQILTKTDYPVKRTPDGSYVYVEVEL